MSIASLTNIEKTFGQRLMFDQLCLNIERGERIGFIGANGSGKTTLFKALIGELIPDSGIVAISKGIKIGHLSQDPSFDVTNTVIDEAELAFGELHALAHKLRDIEHEMGHVQGDALEKALNKYQDVQHDFELAGGYAWRHKLEATLQGVGLLNETWEQAVSTLSGGQRSRLALAKLLISEPDILLLDEPTNHLDLAAIEWLEKYLLSFGGAVVIISHDRYLLDRLATRIIWLTGAKIRSYPGNYTAFVAQRELQELSQQRAYEEQQADIEKQKEFIRRFGAGQRSKEAKGREKRLNRLLISEQMVQAVSTQSHIKLSLGADQRAGDQVLQVRELSKSFDRKRLWDNLKFDIVRGERIGIIGPNGSGKTTMLKVLLAEEDADSGNIKWGANLKLGYYDQRLGVDEFDEESTIAEEVLGDRAVSGQALRDVLGLMLFRGDDADKQIKLLSGGERARVRLAQLLIDKPNVMILDEPTNHLDIATCEALENALRDFDGTVIVVSHDRYFLDRVAKRLFILEPPNMIDFDDNYSAWQRKLAEKAAEEAAESKRSNDSGRGGSRGRSDSGGGRATAVKPAPQQQKTLQHKAPEQNASQQKAREASKKKDNPYARPFGRLSLKELEQQITDTEIAVAECQGTFAAVDAFKNPAKSQKLKSEYDTLAKKLEQLEAEYDLREQ